MDSSDLVDLPAQIKCDFIGRDGYFETARIGCGDSAVTFNITQNRKQTYLKSLKKGQGFKEGTGVRISN